MNEKTLAIAEIALVEALNSECADEWVTTFTRIYTDKILAEVYVILRGAAKRPGDVGGLIAAVQKELQS